ncbi:FimB/Mfa2 family fimbrial subunit [Muribaculum intestinale]|jgi:hypothetical protein|uniref:FimB/Mfa2 family fimbrial subunit n=1 Tax=Muribaculum intestinale TaxID=1796646 RepID=UPI000F49DB0D|nr:FimB/Mfa2 family fimbrial subunit [Muribaculum intestinale]ROT05029.1 hypothetical protein EEL42_10330 [Muribaculaceae bacterium Isolate-100 (HZI)]RXE64479.1 hypothetical protein ED388_11065 [Muribaculaceae bacterium Isolate-007 (NCI)]TGX82412.1 hypothetical protein E5360_08805 [Muribaculum intestinale]
MNGKFLTKIIYSCLAFIGAVGVSSCDALYEDLPECVVTYKVRFTYDMNIKFADAFSHEVDKVTLYVFDSDDRLVWQRTESGESVKARDYAMTVDLPAGTYDMIAWCGGTSPIDDARGFSVGNGSEPVTKADLCSRMERTVSAGDGTHSSDRDLHRHFHAMADNVVFPDIIDGECEVAVMNLTKDTNVIRVVLVHLNGEPINPDHFTVTVTDANGWLGYDNSRLADSEITYSPWSKRSGTTSPDGVTVVPTALITELSVSRLFHGTRPMLTIYNLRDDKVVLSQPLIDYLLMVKGEYNRHMSDQEYLDRVDEYNMTFFLDSDDSWYTRYGIYINSWKVVISDTDLN